VATNIIYSKPQWQHNHKPYRLLWLCVAATGNKRQHVANVATGGLCEVVGGAYPSSDASLQITELSTSRSPLCGWPATMSALRL
jgi:hypothetical protein